MGYRPRVSLLARNRLVRVFQCLLCLGIAVGPRTPVAAQSVALRWDAPKDCASASLVQAKIRELLGEDERTQRPAVQARVRIVRAHGRFELKLDLELGQHRAERKLHGNKCDELSDTVAWLIALAINPELSAPTGRGEPTPDGRAETQRAAGTPNAQQGGSQGMARSRPETDKQAATDNERTDGAQMQTKTPTKGNESATAAQTKADDDDIPGHSGTLGKLSIVNRSSASVADRSLHAGVTTGVFGGGPSAAQASLSAFFGLGFDWSYTQASFSGYLPRRVDISQGASAHVWSLGLDLTQCGLWGTQVRAGPCLSLSGLRTAADVRGLAQPSQHAALWANASAGIQLFWRLARSLDLSFSLGVGTPISPRPRFTVAGLGPIASAKSWSGTAQLGLSFVSD